MAQHKSAIKRARQTLVRTERNTNVKSRTRTVVKRFRAAAEAGEASAADNLKAAESALRRAATKGVIPKRRASRLISRLAKQLAKQSS